MPQLTAAAMNNVVTMALKEQPQIPSNPTNVAGSQRKRLQEMLKVAAIKERPQILNNLINVVGRQRTRLQETLEEASLYSRFLSTGSTEQAFCSMKLDLSSSIS